jgi:hypothetical protein
MGLLGQYMMINEESFESLINLENDDLIDELEDLSEDEENEIYDIDKMWDGLHFILTGISASQPIEGNKLSEAIVGVRVLNEEDENADFIAYTKLDDLPGIIAALKNVDIEKLRLNFDLSIFRKLKVYPNIWIDKEKDNLFNDLIQEYRNILKFYEKALESKSHIIISIY